MKITQIAANQTELHVGDLAVLFSYQTPVAAYNARDEELFTVDPHSLTDGIGISKTTSKHISTWCAGWPNTVEERRPKCSQIPCELFDNLVHNEVVERVINHWHAVAAS